MRKFCFFIYLLAGIIATNPIACAKPAPKLIEPCEGDSIPIEVLLKWEDLSTSNDYTIQIFHQDGHTVISESTTDTHYQVPNGTLSYSTFYSWRVKSSGTLGESDWTDLWSFHTQPVYGNPYESTEEDDDNDGIPNHIEEDLLGTNPMQKTLFIRPIKEKEIVAAFSLPEEMDKDTCENYYEYWDSFYTDLFPGSRDGRANIPAFIEAEIEVMVIGAPDHPYPPMKDNFCYNPAEDDNAPPCDIMAVVLKRRGEGNYPVYCIPANDKDYRGHTYFKADYTVGASNNASTWVWGTKGYTSSSEKSYKYRIPLVYTYPLENYFEEGAYEEIEVDQMAGTIDCKMNSQACNKRSSMNLNRNDPYPNPPYTLNPDDTVEFNEIEFNSDAKITNIQNRGEEYKKIEVMARTVVHEMGHALLSAQNEDHCQNPCCIMYQFTINWDQQYFGPQCNIPESGTDPFSCQHSIGGGQDIRNDGVIYNYSHYRQ